MFVKWLSMHDNQNIQKYASCNTLNINLVIIHMNLVEDTYKSKTPVAQRLSVSASVEL
jgi:hypothetical protein